MTVPSTQSSPRPSERQRRRSAFSLLEVMVAVALFGIGLAAIFQTFGMVSQFLHHQTRMTSGIHAAEQVLEAMLLPSMQDSVFNFTTLHCFDAAAEATDCFETSVFTVEASATETEIPGIFDLLVVCRWKENVGEHSISLKTRRY